MLFISRHVVFFFCSLPFSVVFSFFCIISFDLLFFWLVFFLPFRLFFLFFYFFFSFLFLFCSSLSKTSREVGLSFRFSTWGRSDDGEGGSVGGG